MQEKVTVNFGYRTEGFSNHGVQTEVLITVPEICPHCGKSMTPLVLSALSPDYHSDASREFGALLRCSNQHCKKYFALQFSSSDGRTYSSIELTYSPPIKQDIPDNIVDLSPEFTTIYKQAAQAEANHLDRIAGVGYRKSAEFLYKDFAIRRNPSEEDSIKKMYLKQVIDKYMTDYQKIQSLSTTVAYLGNDETHYERRNTDKDLQDLKRFLISSVKIIDADLDVDESIEFNS